MNIFSRQFLSAWILLSMMLAAAALTGCTSMPIADFKAHITLPASGDGYWVKTVSPEEGRIPKEEWREKMKRGIIILREDWEIFRNTSLKNCLSNTACKSVVGTFDSLFYSIDEALKKVPKP